MNRGIVFFIGLLFGVFICVTLFYFDIKIFESKLIPFSEKEVITQIKTDTVFLEPPPKQKKQFLETQLNDSSYSSVYLINNGDDSSIYETSFSFEGDEQDEIFSDQLLKQRRVKVISLKQEVLLPENSFQFFEIQQWSTPIKNKITYQRNQNMLKIKGMWIDNVNIVFWNNIYYLELNNRYFSISEKEHFEKLSPINVTQ